MKQFIRFCFLFNFIVFAFSCSDNSDNTESNRFNDEILTILPNEKAVGYFPDTNTPYVFLDENNYTIMLYDNNLDLTLDGVFLKSDDSEALIYFDPDTYLPTSMTSSDGDLITFTYNEELTSVIVEFIYQNQESEIVAFETNPDDLTFGTLNRQNITNNNTDAIGGAQLGLQAAGFAVSFVTCITSTAVAAAGIPLTGGLATALTGPTAIISCSSAIANFVGFFNSQNPNAQLLPTEFTVLNNLGIVVDSYQCLSGSLSNCFNAITALGPYGLGILEDLLNSLEINQFSGQWSGTYFGGDSGTWILQVTQSGTIVGSATSVVFGNSYSLNGNVNSQGTVLTTLGGASSGSTFYGIMSGNTAEGNWMNSVLNLSGTWSGNKD